MTRSRGWRSAAPTASTSCATRPRTCMAQAVQQLYPEAKLGIGPPIHGRLLLRLRRRRCRSRRRTSRSSKQRCARSSRRTNASIRRWSPTDEDALVELADEPYKLELIGLKGSAADAAEGATPRSAPASITIYDNLDRRGRRSSGSDLCRGPHLPTTKRISDAFKLTRSVGRVLAAATRRTSSSSASTAPPGRAKEELDERLPRADRGGRAPRPPQARPRTGPVLVPRRARLRPAGVPPQGRHHHAGRWRTTSASATSRRATSYVDTPHITKDDLYEVSGHLGWYRTACSRATHVDDEFHADGTVRKPAQDYYLKPMNCPMHNLIFS